MWLRCPKEMLYQCATSSGRPLPGGFQLGSCHQAEHSQRMGLKYALRVGKTSILPP